jgi:hypothetical protein
MTNKELFKQAIADAKAVRDAALANAKVALEESLQPQIENMLNTKLQEIEDEDEDLKENQDEDSVTEGDLDLEEMLAELELEEGDDSELDEAKDEDDKKDDKKDEKKDDKKSEKKDDAPKAPKADDFESEDDKSITDLSVDELKALIQDVIASEIGSGADHSVSPVDPAGPEAPVDSSLPPADGSDLDVPAVDAGAEGDIDATHDVATDIDSEGDEDEVDLEELLAELDELDSDDDVSEAKELEKELNEAIKTIKTLQAQLNEVNLLNSKLLYVNKIFKNKNLNESQKVKVINAFDKATTPKEAKVVYEALNESLNVAAQTKKNVIKENLGFASKPTGVASQKQQIVETNAAVARFQKLAGIIK